MTTDSLIIELGKFLRSSATNVERMSDTLCQELAVDTKLDKVIKAAAEKGQAIVVAGTAGSGKTHLIRAVGQADEYRVVPDLAALPQKEWPDLFTKGSKLIVAGNEGAFLQGKMQGFATFDEVVRLLHRIQLGDVCKEDGPVVIDAAAFDPCGQHVVEKMLEKPLLLEYAKKRGDRKRFAAWEMFDDRAVRDRVAVLVEAASAESEADGFTFRQLWQFVADILDRGEGFESLWFWRVFYGNSEISRRIRQVFSPSLLALPHTGNRLWYGDLMEAGTAFLDCCQEILAEIVPPPNDTNNEELSVEKFENIRILGGFGLQNSPIEFLLKQSNDLWQRIRNQKDTLALLQGINNYMVYDFYTAGSDLELWMQHDTERRQKKPAIQISMGSANAERFEIRRNQVVANPPEGTSSYDGGRVLLVHKDSKASLTITKDFVEGLLRGRSHRTRDRRSVEYDWRLLRFLSQVADFESRTNKLLVIQFDFQARSHKRWVWQFMQDRIERLEGA